MSSKTYFTRNIAFLSASESIFSKENYKTFCSVGCSIGCDVYDFLFLLIKNNNYNKNIQLFGCDINKYAINCVNGDTPFKCAKIQMFNNFSITEDNSGVFKYPYPILMEQSVNFYKDFFTEDLIMRKEFQTIPNFFVHNIIKPLPSKYDIIFCFNVLMHFHEKQRNKKPFDVNFNPQLIYDVMDNLVSATNKILVLNCGKFSRKNLRYFIFKYLNNNHIHYKMYTENVLFIYPK